jgi:excisionase family DNA binding protein
VKVEKEERLLTPKEASKKLGVSVRSVYDLIASGKIRAKERKSLSGNRRFWLIPAAEVEKLQKNKEGGGEAQ